MRWGGDVVLVPFYLVGWFWIILACIALGGVALLRISHHTREEKEEGEW